MPRHDYDAPKHFTTPGLLQVFVLKDHGATTVAIRQSGPSRSTLYLYPDTTYRWETDEDAIHHTHWMNPFVYRNTHDLWFLIDTLRKTVLR